MKAPCPSCLACGATTTRHQWCSDGPPPPHGPACLCPFCDGPRVENIIAIARHFADGLPHPELAETLRRLLALRDQAPEREREHWQANRSKIRAAEVAA